MPAAGPLPAGRGSKISKAHPAEEATRTAEYWDLVHGKGRVAYFLSTRDLHSLLKPFLRQSPADAAAQLLLEDAHAAALPCGSWHQRQQQKQLLRIAEPLAPLSQSLLELMCGSRPTHVRLLHGGTVSTYVGIDASQRALQLAREACKHQTSSRAQAARGGSGTPAEAPAAGLRAGEGRDCCRSCCCMHEEAGKSFLLHRDCRLLSEELPLLQCRVVLLVAGLDDIIARSTTDNADCHGPCDEALLQVLHSAAHALPVGGTLLLVEPTKHAPELLLSLYKALQHPVLCCRYLLCEGVELVGPSKEVLFVRLRRDRDAGACLQALEGLHRTAILKLAGKKLLPQCLPGALEAPQSVLQSLPLALRLSFVQQTKELAFLLMHACKEGDFLAATKLLALGADPNYSSSSSSSSGSDEDSSMSSPLHAAVFCGDPQLVNLLMRRGAAASEEHLSLATELLLEEALAAGLSLPMDITAHSAASAAAPAIAASNEEQLLRSIVALSWVEGAFEIETGGPSCGGCRSDKDFLLRAAAVPPVPSLTWPCGDPSDVRFLASRPEGGVRLQRWRRKGSCAVFRGFEPKALLSLLAFHFYSAPRLKPR
ncbi:hypothetical protein Esti_005197 [Eimeria stiedai]